MGCPNCPDSESPAAPQPAAPEPAAVRLGQTAFIVYTGGPPAEPFRMIRHVLPHGPGGPTIHDDGSIEYPKAGAEAPGLLEGFERDPADPWRLIPVWEPCQLRMYAVTPKQDCSCLSLSAVCNHPGAGAFTGAVTHPGCRDCPVRLPISSR